MGEQTKFASLKSQSGINFFSNESPKCPHCGHDCDIKEMEDYQLYEEGEHDIECPSCDLPFIVSVHVFFKFSTEDQVDENGEAVEVYRD